MFKMKNILLILHAVVLSLTLSILIIPEIWTIKVVGGADGIKGVAFPPIWIIYALTVFLVSGLTFSWLVKSK